MGVYERLYPQLRSGRSMWVGALYSDDGLSGSGGGDANASSGFNIGLCSGTPNANLGGFTAASWLFLLKPTGFATARRLFQSGTSSVTQRQIATSGTAGDVRIIFDMTSVTGNQYNSSDTPLAQLNRWVWFVVTVNTNNGNGDRIRIYTYFPGDNKVTKRTTSVVSDISAANTFSDDSGSANAREVCSAAATSQFPGLCAYFAMWRGVELTTDQIFEFANTPPMAGPGICGSYFVGWNPLTGEVGRAQMRDWSGNNYTGVFTGFVNGSGRKGAEIVPTALPFILNVPFMRSHTWINGSITFSPAAFPWQTPTAHLPSELDRRGVVTYGAEKVSA